MNRTTTKQIHGNPSETLKSVPQAPIFSIRNGANCGTLYNSHVFRILAVQPFTAQSGCTPSNRHQSWVHLRPLPHAVRPERTSRHRAISHLDNLLTRAIHTLESDGSHRRGDPHRFGPASPFTPLAARVLDHKSSYPYSVASGRPYRQNPCVRTARIIVTGQTDLDQPPGPDRLRLRVLPKNQRAHVREEAALQGQPRGIGQGTVK
jgi:hypothetical protein